MAETVSSDSVAQDQLAAFVRRIESLEDEIKALNSDKSEVYREAKGNGFDVKVLRKIIADRRKDLTDRMEFEAVYDLYAAALGMQSVPYFDRDEDEPHGRARAPAREIIEQNGEDINSIDPLAGEITPLKPAETSAPEGRPEGAGDEAPENTSQPTFGDLESFEAFNSQAKASTGNADDSSTQVERVSDLIGAGAVGSGDASRLSDGSGTVAPILPVGGDTDHADSGLGASFLPEVANPSTAAGTDLRDNSTGQGARAELPDPAAATTLPAGTQAPPVDTQ